MATPYHVQPPPQDAPQDAANNLHAGWFVDPWGAAQWRWWDGQTWTAYTQTSGVESKPRLPSFLSIPVIFGMLVTIPAVAYTAFLSPLAVLLGLVPICIVLPTFAWLDRVEPEPRSSQIHALLWGACVAALVSGVVNSIAAFSVGESFATVVSAPVVEELTKGLAVYWAVRRREVDSVMDGIVYAGWAALGFAVVEDFLYFFEASTSGSLFEVFVLRALLTPFAHPLFTMWIGLGIGWAVSKNKSIFLPAFIGYIAAVAGHALWNGSLVYSSAANNGSVLLTAVLCFVALFLVSVVAISLMRNRSVVEFERSVPALAQLYGMTPQEVMVFGDWRQMLRTRKTLSKPNRKKFDRVHTALARLAALHNRPGEPDPIDVQILADQLYRARNTD